MQVVLSVLLLVLGTIFPRSFFREDLGFDAAHTVITAVHPFPRPNERGPWRDRLIRRIKHVPGVVGVTSTQTLPLMGEVDYVDVRRKNDPLSATRNAYWIGQGSSRVNKGATNEMRYDSADSDHWRRKASVHPELPGTENGRERPGRADQQPLQRVWEIRVDSVLKLDRAVKREPNEEKNEEVPR